MAPARFPCLDAVRALGATAVVATHVGFQTGRSTAGPLSGTIARGDVGVALFFVLSGFLLFRPWVVSAASQGPRPGIRHYLRRRALRILPAYWLVVTASLVLLPSNEGIRSFSIWVRHLTLTQVYSLGLQRHGLTQTWSLCTEVAFYLLLPVLAATFLSGWRPRTWVLLGLLSATSVGWQVVITSTRWLDASDAGQWLPGYLDWFAGGMALALVQVHPPTRWTAGLHELGHSPSTCWAAALGIFAIATSPVAGPRGLQDLPSSWDAVLKNLLYLAVALLVVLPLVLGPQDVGSARRFLASRPVRRLGVISYGIFLWHLLVLETVVRALHQTTFTGSWLTTFALTWTLSVIAAELSYRLLERPAMRLGDQRSSSNADQTTASPALQSS